MVQHGISNIHGKSTLLVIGMIAAAVVILFLLLVPGINRIPTLDEEVIASWSQVTNQYQRRADLIPNLVNTVKGYASHEKDVLTAVTEARSRVSQYKLPKDVLTNPQAFQQFQSSQDQLSSALSRLLLVVEKYPDLKANQNFLSLQSQLEGTENRITVARRDYINTVKIFNTHIRTIPGRWFQAIFFPELTVKQNFTVSESVEQAPEVKFN